MLLIVMLLAGLIKALKLTRQSSLMGQWMASSRHMDVKNDIVPLVYGILYAPLSASNPYCSELDGFHYTGLDPAVITWQQLVNKVSIAF